MENWNKADKDGNIDVPDYLMPLLDKIGMQLRLHTESPFKISTEPTIGCASNASPFDPCPPFVQELNPPINTRHSSPALFHCLLFIFLFFT